MSDSDAWNYVQLELVAKRSGVVTSLKKAFDRMIADYRFGRLRNTKLSLVSQHYLLRLKESMFRLPISKPTNATSQESTPERRESKLTKTVVPKVLSEGNHSVAARAPNHTRWISPSIPKERDFDIGDRVVCYIEHDGYPWHLGEVVGFDDDSDEDLPYEFDVSVVMQGGDGPFEENVVVDRADMRLVGPVVENLRVVGYFVDNPVEERWEFPGIVSRVMPSGHVSVYFDDGDIVHGIPPGEYRYLVEGDEEPSDYPNPDAYEAEEEEASDYPTSEGDDEHEYADDYEDEEHEDDYEDDEDQYEHYY